MSSLSHKRSADILEDKENMPVKKAAPAAPSFPPADPVDFFDTAEDAPEAVEEVDEGVLGEAGRNWVRPDPPAYDPAQDKLGA